MATDKDWALGYLEQARADLDAAQALRSNGLSPARSSVFAMLLQMAFEKLAKAALLRSGNMKQAAARSSHRGASALIAIMYRHQKLIAPLGGSHLWTAAFDVVQDLERAQPSLAKGTAQLEYPWETSSGVIQSPARDLPIAQRLANPKSNLAAHVVNFADQLQRKFDEIFPP